MNNNHCAFCQLAQNHSEPTFIFAWPNSVAYLNFAQQDYPGYALLVLKNHYDHLHHVPAPLLHSFIDERAQLAAAIFKAFPQTTRMNYANLGNAVSHVHEHLIPRHKGDSKAGRAPWPMNEYKKLEAREYQIIADKIRAAL